TMQKQANNSWNMTGQINPADGIMTDNLVSNISFNQDGSFSQVTGAGLGNPTMTVQLTGFAGPQTLSFAFGTAGGFQGLTQTGGIGAVQQKQLESSNVDVSLEFTRLIIAQQGYEVNAHVITAANQVLQALTNIIH